MNSKKRTSTNKKNNFYNHLTQIGLALLMLIFTTTLTAQNVYVAGYDDDASSSKTATIWDGNGVKNNLTNGNRTARANDIFIDNSDQYVAGYESNGVKYIAKIWKNGTAQNLTDGTKSAYASAVFVYNGDVYVVGYEDNGTKNVAKLWKNGNAQNLTDGSENARAESVFVANDDVYVVGLEYDFSVDSNFSDSVIKVWKNGTPQDLTDGTNDVDVNSIFIDNGDTYVAGREDNGTNYIAKLWKNGNPQNLTDASSRAEANSVFVSNGDVYVAGYDGDEPKLWKNGTLQTLSINSAFDGARAKSVYVSGNDVYVAGTSTVSNGNDQCTFATFWKNGNIDFFTGCPEYTAMNSVFVDDGQLSVENTGDPQNKLNLYPNPVQDILHIETTTNTVQKIDLFSITGQRLQTWERQDEINMAQFAPGSYFLKITTDNDRTEIKQIIKK